MATHKMRINKRQTNPLFALRSTGLLTLDEIEAMARLEIAQDTFLSGEQEDLICIIPSLCAQIRIEAERTSQPSSGPEPLGSQRTTKKK